MKQNKIKKTKRGISLIVLIITIIVVIILAAVVILTLSKNNPIESAKEAAFKEDIRAYQDELNMYITKEYQSLAGQRDSKITATGYEKDSASEEYGNSVYKYLSSFKKKYENKIVIENDEIVYIGRDKKEREWTNNIVKMNAILTVKYVYENGEEAAPTYEETVTDGAYEVDSPIIDGYEPDHYTVSDKIDKDTEITVTYYPWSEGLAYEELADGTYMVVGIGDFRGENLVIPRKYKEKNATQVKSSAFRYIKTIKKLVIPSTVEIVGQSAFEGCSNITYVSLNAKKTNGQWAFDGCNLNKVDIGRNVEYIGGRTFHNRTNLTDVTIYTEKADINSAIFNGCTALKELKVNDDNNKYKVMNGVLYSKDGKKIYMYPTGKEGETYIIPPSVKEIGVSAFYSNKNLTNIEIPSTVEIVGQSAFEGCSNITYVSLNAKKTNGQWAFDGCNLNKLDIGGNVEYIGSRTFNNCKNIEEVNYKGTINEWNEISKNGWNNNSNITKVICTDGEVEL